MSADIGLRGLDLLDAVIAQIEAHPETWSQSRYRCETGMCLAGWAAEMTGGQWLTGPASALAPLLLADDDDDPADTEDFPEDDEPFSGVLAIESHIRAQRLIGLTEDQAERLFAGGNTLPDIKLIRAGLGVAAGGAE